MTPCSTNALDSSTSVLLPADNSCIRDLLTCSVDVLMSLDTAGRIRFVSTSYVDLTGDHPSEACGKSCLEYVSEADIDRTAGEIAWVLANGSQIEGFENLVRGKDGNFRVVSWRGKKAPDGNLCAIGRDITNQKAAEHRALAAQRWDAIDQLAGGVAHEFNNILAGILGYLELASRLASDERLKRILDSALLSGRKGASTVEKMLSCARSRQLKLERIDLHVLLAGVAAAISSAARPKARIHYRTYSGALPICVDIAQLQVCVLSLCINAAESMASAGEIWIDSQLSIASEVGELRLKPGEYARLRISDNGQGMSPETSARCFEPFYTTRGPSHGRGLGLSHVFGVITQFGGTVRLDSQLGKGTTVDLFVPLAR